MKSIILACCLFFTGLAHAAAIDPVLAQQVNLFMDGWHDDAAHARMRYFDKMAPDGVYIGTDRNELWQRDAFREWGRKYFEGKQAAWVFHPTRRNLYATPDGSLIWFDELLDTQNMGHCMASGVIRRTVAGFEIVHYQLSLAVPNEVACSTPSTPARMASAESTISRCEVTGNPRACAVSAATVMSASGSRKYTLIADAPASANRLTARRVSSASRTMKESAGYAGGGESRCGPHRKSRGTAAADASAASYASVHCPGSRTEVMPWVR